MKTQYLELSKAKFLEDTLGLLSDLTPLKGISYQLKINGKVNDKLTKAIQRLSKLNQERAKLLKTIMEFQGE